jgi:FMN phosphatase YigB (HAD superfamily)
LNKWYNHGQESVYFSVLYYFLKGVILLKVIRNVICDWGDVLCAGFSGLEILIEAELGIPAKEFLARRVAVNDAILDVMRSGRGIERYWQLLASGTSWDVNPQWLNELILRNFASDFPNSAIEIIKELKRKYRLIMLSDHVLSWVEHIKTTPGNDVFELFDDVIFTYEAGELKGDPLAFTHLLDRLKIKAEETLFIDDLLVNIQAAERQGITSILYTDPNNLRKELASHDIHLSEKR